VGTNPSGSNQKRSVNANRMKRKGMWTDLRSEPQAKLFPCRGVGHSRGGEGEFYRRKGSGDNVGWEKKKGV